MDALSFMQSTVASVSVPMDVYRNTSTGSYDSDKSSVGTVSVSVFAPTSVSEVVTEGSGQDTSLTGLAEPAPNAGDPLPSVKVNDELRVQSNPEKRYVVKTKDGYPSDINPELVRLGLEPSNSNT